MIYNIFLIIKNVKNVLYLYIIKKESKECIYNIKECIR